MRLRYLPIDSDSVAALREPDALDAYGHPPERAAHSKGTGTPCRHCLKQVPQDQPFLILAYRPFQGLNPYTETGPIFLCAQDCVAGGPDFPTEFLAAPAYILRGYSADERIIYGTGAVTPVPQIADRCHELLQREDVAFVHIRSSTNNCFHCRVERG